MMTNKKKVVLFVIIILLYGNVPDADAAVHGTVFRIGKQLVSRAIDAGKKIRKSPENAVRNLSAVEMSFIRSGSRARVAGRDVIKRNQTFDPYAKDALGRTNRQRMSDGFAPIGRDGRELHLHHMQQKNKGLIVEMTSTEHRSNSSVLHRYRNQTEINRNSFNQWKRDYWKKRAEDFK